MSNGENGFGMSNGGMNGSGGTIGGGKAFLSPESPDADGVSLDDSCVGSLAGFFTGSFAGFFPDFPDLPDDAPEDSLDEPLGALLDDLAEDLPLVPDWSSETSGRISATLVVFSALSVTGSATGSVAGIRTLSSSARAVGAPRATTADVIPTAVIPIMGRINFPPISVKTTRAR